MPEKKTVKKATKKSTLKTEKKSVKKPAKKSVKKSIQKSAKMPVQKSAKTTIQKPASKTASVIELKNSQKLPSPSAVDSKDGFRKPSDDADVRKLLEDIVTFLDEKKLIQIKAMNLEEVNPYFCFFIIATANSTMQLGTTAREISRRFGNRLINKKTRPDEIGSGWVIHDFGDILLHLFLDEQRSYYNLEKLWGDAAVIYCEEEPRFQWPHKDKKTAE